MKTKTVSKKSVFIYVSTIRHSELDSESHHYEVGCVKLNQVQLDAIILIENTY